MALFVVIWTSVVDDMRAFAFLQPLLHSFALCLFKLHEQRRMIHLFYHNIRLPNHIAVIVNVWDYCGPTHPTFWAIRLLARRCQGLQAVQFLQKGDSGLPKSSILVKPLENCTDERIEGRLEHIYLNLVPFVKIPQLLGMKSLESSTMRSHDELLWLFVALN